jgi:hypothetical protein
MFVMGISNSIFSVVVSMLSHKTLFQESLNSDCQQFHQDQQKRTTTSHTKSLKTNKPRHMA